jgi:hypothetical protein
MCIKIINMVIVVNVKVVFDSVQVAVVCRDLQLFIMETFNSTELSFI